MNIQWKGRPDACSFEFVRACLGATICILRFHNMKGPDDLLVQFVPVVDGDRTLAGISRGRHIELARGLATELMATTIIHELIHEFANFGEGTDEKCTSTLTARLKPEIVKIAQVLVDGTYKRAAYLAHTKMTYRAAGDDHYDEAQWVEAGATDPYSRKDPEADGSETS